MVCNTQKLSEGLQVGETLEYCLKLSSKAKYIKAVDAELPLVAIGTTKICAYVHQEANKKMF